MEKHLLHVAFAIIISMFLFGCDNTIAEKVENDYYRISIRLPRVAKGMLDSHITDGKVDIDKLPRYENDSAAIADELQRSNDFDKMCIDSTRKYVSIQSKAGNGTIEYYKADAHIEVYAELLEERRILMRISHKRDYDPTEFLGIISEEGRCYSEKARQYIENNKIDVAFYPIKE